MNDDEINEIIARTDDEANIFRELDVQRERDAAERWKAAGNRGKPPPSLITIEELPEFYRSDEPFASKDEYESKQKALEELNANREALQAREAALAMTGSSPLLRAKHAHARNGIVTPDRFGGRPQPQPPRLSPRHVQFQNDSSSASRVNLAENVSLPPGVWLRGLFVVVVCASERQGVLRGSSMSDELVNPPL